MFFEIYFLIIIELFIIENFILLTLKTIFFNLKKCNFSYFLNINLNFAQSINLKLFKF